MGRPKLFHTVEEKLRAKRVYSKTYYTKNQDQINVKNRERYHKKREMRELPEPAVAGPSSERLRYTSEHDTQPASAYEDPPVYTSPSPEPPSDTIEGLESELMALVDNSLVEFLELIIRDIMCTAAATSFILLARTTNEAQELLTRAQSLHGKALQIGGCRAELCNLERTQHRISCVFHAFEEVLLLARTDMLGLVRGRRCRELFYQTHSDIVPIIYDR